MIVERLRNAKAEEVVFVVPKRALLVQGVVNLKILKKEADKLGREIILVTQDAMGKLLAEKLELTSFNRLEEVGGKELEEEMEEEPERKKNVVENRVGSRDFSDLQPGLPIKDFRTKKKKNSSVIKISVKNMAEGEDEEALINTELVSINQLEPSKSNVLVQKAPALSNMVDEESISFSTDQEVITETSEEDRPKKRKEQISERLSKNKKGEADRIAKLFQNRPATEYFSKASEKKREPAVTLGGNFFRRLKIGVVILAIIGLGSFGYLYIPGASISLVAKSKSENQGLEVQAKSEINDPQLENKVIPLRSTSESGEVTDEFSPSGVGSGSGQKARGQITVYNEFSSDSQPLVATTRFADGNGNIFRLVNGITVPGTKNGAPGTMTAEVIADQSGENYNIGAGDFTIPGFQSNSEKYKKIYAKSTTAMQGGSDGDQIKAVTKNDIERAKNQLKTKLQNDLTDKINQKLEPGEKLLNEAVNLDSVNFSVSANEGATVDNFSVTAQGQATGFIFSENYLKQMAALAMNAENKNFQEISPDQIILQYGKADIDFVKKEMIIRANALGKMIMPLDLDKVKKQILGKTEGEFRAYLGAYPQIDQAEINYWPTFINGKIPPYPSRVKIELDNN